MRKKREAQRADKKWFFTWIKPEVMERRAATHRDWWTDEKRDEPDIRGGKKKTRPLTLWSGWEQSGGRHIWPLDLLSWCALKDGFVPLEDSNPLRCYQHVVAAALIPLMLDYVTAILRLISTTCQWCGRLLMARWPSRGPEGGDSNPVEMLLRLNPLNCMFSGKTF